jgi:hypothetical protein
VPDWLVVVSYRFSGTAEPTGIRNLLNDLKPTWWFRLRAVPPVGAMRAIAPSMPQHAAAALQGDSEDFAAGLNIKLWDLVVRDRLAGGGELPLFWNSRAHGNSKLAERFEAHMVV